MRAAMVGGGAYMAGKHAERGQQREPAAAPQVDVVSQLTQLKELLDAGALTQAEFDAQKQKLLGG